MIIINEYLNAFDKDEIIASNVLVYETEGEDVYKAIILMTPDGVKEDFIIFQIIEVSEENTKIIYGEVLNDEIVYEMEEVHAYREKN